MWKRAILLTVGWLVAAATTTAVGVAAIDTLGAGLIGQTGDDAPMTAADVQRRLADEPTASLTADPDTDPNTASSSTPASAEATGPPAPRSNLPTTGHQGANSPRPSLTAGGSMTRTLDVRGGTVQARCSDDGQATLIAWSPAPGFHVEDANRGPAASLSIKFTRDHAETRTVITCVDGAPVARSVLHDD